jgi:ribosomal protein L36
MNSLLVPTQLVSSIFWKNSNKLKLHTQIIKRRLILRVVCYHSIHNLYRLIYTETQTIKYSFIQCH